MTYNTKPEFLTGLREALERNNVTDIRDILTDFRQHFDDGEASGETEAEVCRKLGDVDDIVKQYISDMSEKKAAEAAEAVGATGFDSEFGQTQTAQYAAPVQMQPQPQQSGADGGKIAGVLILDFLVYCWALPALLGLIFALIGVAISFSATGITLFVAGIISFGANLGGMIVTGFAPVSILCLGIMFIGLGGMLVIASISSVKGFINLCIAIVNQHSRAFAGKNVANKIGKKEVGVQ